MSEGISFGTIVITDVNENNYYDPDIDLVTDYSGRLLQDKEKSKRLSGILQDIGVSRWQGLALFEASNYLYKFSNAERLSYLGYVEAVEEILTEVKEEAKKLPLQYPQARERKIIKRALERGFAAEWNRAQEAAQEGKDVSWAVGYLDQAENYSTRLWQEYRIRTQFSAKKKTDLLKLNYKNWLAELKSKAETFSKGGEIEITKKYVTRAIRVAREGNSVFSLGLTMPQDKIDQIMKEVYSLGVPKLYKVAQELADQGHPKEVKKILKDINDGIQDANRIYGLGLNHDYQQEKEIYRQALRQGVISRFKMSAEEAGKKRPALIELWMEEAKEFAREYGELYPHAEKLEFDAIRAQALIDCSKGLMACPK